MVPYEVVAHEGVGPVKLGMSREESRAAMQATPDTFLKAVDYDVETDAYHDSSFQVFFDAGDRAEYIELSASASLTVLYKGCDVFETGVRDLVELVSRDSPYDPEDPEFGYSYIFPKLDLALWRPVVPENETDSEGRFFSTVGVGRRGYFSAPTNQKAEIRPRWRPEYETVAPSKFLRRET